MSNHAELTIGIAAERSGCTVPTIRYYEEIGLLPKAARKTGGHRVYGRWTFSGLCSFGAAGSSVFRSRRFAS